MNTENNGRWTTDSLTHYRNVKLVGDARYFPEEDGRPAATFIRFVHGTKGGKDVFVDAKITRSADLMSGLRKGDVVCITGRLELAYDKKGELQGKIYHADVATLVRLKDRTTVADAPELPPAPGATPQEDFPGPAFD